VTVVRIPFSATTELKLFPLENDAIVQTQPVAFLTDGGVESFVEKGGKERTNNRKYLIAIVVDLSGLVLSQVTARSLLISETRVQHHMTSSKILSKESGSGSGFSPSLSYFLPLITSPPLRHTHLSPPHEILIPLTKQHTVTPWVLG
jgi:hypothetical protein